MNIYQVGNQTNQNKLKRKLELRRKTNSELKKYNMNIYQVRNQEGKIK